MSPKKGELLIIAFLYIFAIVAFTGSEDRALAPKKPKPGIISFTPQLGLNEDQTGKQPERRSWWLKHGGGA